MKIKKPIFIIGVGRSGSTVFFDMLSRHNDVTWMAEKLLNNFPSKPILNRILMSSLDIPIVGGMTRRVFEPGECYTYWNNLYRGFGRPFRDLKKHDVTVRAKRRIRLSLSQLISRKRERLLVKITGWNRICFLREIFPDALFVLVKRDPRAVINSFLNVDFWSGWQGPLNWRMGEISDEQKEELYRFDFSFVALAGIKIEILHNAFVAACSEVNCNNILEIKYEDFCGQPVQTIRNAIDFCGLEWTIQFEEMLRSFKIKNTNYKWKQDLTKDQQKIAEYYYRKIGY